MIYGRLVHDFGLLLLSLGSQPQLPEEGYKFRVPIGLRCSRLCFFCFVVRIKRARLSIARLALITASFASEVIVSLPFRYSCTMSAFASSSSPATNRRLKNRGRAPEHCMHSRSASSIYCISSALADDDCTPVEVFIGISIRGMSLYPSRNVISAHKSRQ